ncbi:hypothetical protein BAMA_10360 [Bacillus manliponensis]|uniref:Uncharacterized protein n=1 Tax=Bacillus manliponensis TaxID=574376 RepID=A0A073JUH8_9BACI|nr:hypothetical protein [Bacillus manliponensis]KEK17882.1 hypothetical protein BAMA_10360 [Bacillus manliponensis]
MGNTSIKIAGKGLSLEDIASVYLDLIETDFDMTISEMADYLSCSYDYIQKNIAPVISHIYINSVAKKALQLHESDSGQDHLFTKRKLFSRSSFGKYILENTSIVVSKNRYLFHDLSESSRRKLQQLASSTGEDDLSFDLFKSIAIEQAKNKYSSVDLEDRTVKKLPLSKFPEKLYSLKEIMEGKTDSELKFNYKMEFYRYIEKQGIPKIEFQSLIRYKKEDLEKKAVFLLPLTVVKGDLLEAVEEFITNELEEL